MSFQLNIHSIGHSNASPLVPLRQKALELETVHLEVFEELGVPVASDEFRRPVHNVVFLENSQKVQDFESRVQWPRLYGLWPFSVEIVKL